MDLPSIMSPMEGAPGDAMTVWLVIHGADYESEDVEGIFASYEGARAQVEKEYLVPGVAWKEDGEDRWRLYPWCLEIQEREVLP